MPRTEMSIGERTVRLPERMGFLVAMFMVARSSDVYALEKYECLKS